MKTWQALLLGIPGHLAQMWAPGRGRSCRKPWMSRRPRVTLVAMVVNQCFSS